jgi:DnaJ-class molecular chaperone
MEDKRYEDMTPGDEAPPGEPSSGEDVCEACQGTGRVDGERCESCGGTGRVVRGVGGG